MRLAARGEGQLRAQYKRCCSLKITSAWLVALLCPANLTFCDCAKQAPLTQRQPAQATAFDTPISTLYPGLIPHNLSANMAARPNVGADRVASHGRGGAGMLSQSSFPRQQRIFNSYKLLYSISKWLNL